MKFNDLHAGDCFDRPDVERAMKLPQVRFREEWYNAVSIGPRTAGQLWWISADTTVQKVRRR